MRHDQDTCAIEGGGSLRVLNDGVFVRPDPPPDKSASGLIHYPGGAVEHVLNTGVVEAFGTMHTKKGKEVPIPGVGVGSRVCFVRYLADQTTNVDMSERYGGVIRLKPGDVLFVYDEEDHHRVR